MLVRFPKNVKMALKMGNTHEYLKKMKKNHISTSESYDNLEQMARVRI